MAGLIGGTGIIGVDVITSWAAAEDPYRNLCPMSPETWVVGNVKPADGTVDTNEHSMHYRDAIPLPRGVTALRVTAQTAAGKKFGNIKVLYYGADGGYLTYYSSGGKDVTDVQATVAVPDGTATIRVASWISPTGDAADWIANSWLTVCVRRARPDEITQATAAYAAAVNAVMSTDGATGTLGELQGAYNTLTGGTL